MSYDDDMKSWMHLNRGRIWKWFIHGLILHCSFSPVLFLIAELWYAIQGQISVNWPHLYLSPLSLLFPSLILVLSFSSLFPLPFSSICVWFSLTGQFCVTCLNAVSLLKGRVGYFIVSFTTGEGKAESSIYSTDDTENFPLDVHTLTMQACTNLLGDKH